MSEAMSQFESGATICVFVYPALSSALRSVSMYVMLYDRSFQMPCRRVSAKTAAAAATATTTATTTTTPTTTTTTPTTTTTTTR
jgi:hypothetical protein